MAKSTKSISLQSYAFQLRKVLVYGCSLEKLLSHHKKHQEVLLELRPHITPENLSFSDRFAWKFIREVNILDRSYLDRDPDSLQGSSQKTQQPASGVYQDLARIVSRVQEIWFPAMESPPNTVWLKHYSTRKLAHYAKHRDEIAFSLIFDSPDTPPEILNYLAYHELLHRRVGSKVVNGRRYHHTGEFKNQEQLFPNWRQVEDQIREYIVNTI